MEPPRSLLRRVAALAVLAGLVALVLPSVPAQAAAPKPAARRHFASMTTAPGRTLLGPSHARSGSSLRRGGTQQALVADPTSGAAKSTWTVTYTGFSTQAQTAFQAAVDIWSRTITASVPIKVSASFSDLGTGVLGSAGASSNYSGGGLGDGVSYYPAALADQLVGYNIGSSDITAQFSSTYSFYFGTDGATPAGQIDFESVVLHELGHGLGFAGFMSYSGGSGSYSGPGRFDQFTYNALTGGSKLISLASVNTSSTTLGTALTSGSVYWGGTSGMASNGGVRPKLYAPSTWSSGSSYSHLDESTYPAGNTNSLMTYAVGNGEAVHSPGPITVGVLNDLGYHAYITGAVTTPSAPTSVTAVAGNGQATVSWTAGSNNGGTITSSTVTSSPGGKTVTVSGTGTSGTVTGLTNGTAYTFTVTQTNSVGTSDASSASSSVTPVGPPNAPTGVSATRTSGTGGSATVSWTASTTNGSAVTGYTVTPSPSGTAVTVGSGVTSAAVTGLTNGSSYTFTVTASSAAGTSASSSASSAVVPGTVPSAPTGVTATGGNGSASVAFTAGSSNGYAITGYTVTSSPGSFTGTGTTSPVTVSGLTNGTAYTFTVKATNSLGTSSASSASSSVTPADVPSQISSVTATRGDSTASLTWSAPASNGASIIDYTVTASPGGATKTVTTTSATMTGLTNGTSYTFTVKARNSAGSGIASPASSSVTPAGVPGTPTLVTATRTSGAGGSVDVSWTAPSGNGSTITGYTVTASPGGATKTVTTTSATVTGLTNGTSYTFTVTATNAVGTGTGATSAAAVPATVPSAPTNVTAVAGDSSAYVSWTAPASNGSAITGYAIEPSSGPSWLISDPSTTGFTVTGLTNGTAYTFTVTAISAVGFGSASAATSAVTPAGLPGTPSSVTATRTSGTGSSVTVTWTAPSSNGSAITGYTVTASPGGATRTVTTTSAVMSGLTNGTSYTFSVTATNAVGTGSSGTSAAAVPGTVPSTVTGVGAAAGDGAAFVTWTAPSANGYALTGFVVTPSSGSPVTVNDPSATGVSVPGLTNGTAYTFTVAAVNAIGTGTASDATSAVTPSGLPGQVTGLTAVAGSSSALLTWTAASSNGSPLTGHTIVVSPGGATVSTSGTATGATVTGLTNGTSYTFTVTALNANGAGPVSSASNAVVPGDVPSAVASVSAVAGPGAADLSWPVATTDGYPVLDYTVTASPGGATKTVSATSTTFSGLTNGTSYTFSVRARNALGSGLATTSSAVTPAGVPGAPTAVTAALGSGTGVVDVSWTAAAANGSPVTGYVVTSSPGGVTVSTTGTSAEVTDLVEGTAYTFTVVASNGVGAGSASVPTSAVTPASVPDAPTAVLATAGDTSAFVSWVAPAAHGSALTGYVVTPSCASPLTVSDGSATGVLVSGLTNGTSCTFTVAAVNGRGTGAGSAASVAVVPSGLPGQVTGVTATRAGSGALALTWAVPSDNGSPITGYEVTGGPAGPVSTGSTVAGALVTGLENGTTYSFTVRALNGNGLGTASDATAPFAPATVPGQVTGVTAVAGTTSATVSWAAPADNGSPVTGYVVTPSSGTPLTVGPVTSAVVSGLTNGTTYTFTVQAVNALGAGAASDPSASVTADSAAPVVALTSTPAALSRSTSAAFTWTATDPDRSDVTVVTCSLDGAAFSSCATSYAVAAGSHTFTVHAADDRGNVGTAAFTWLVDLTAPALTVPTPAVASLGTTAPVTFSATDAGSGVAAFLVRTRRAGSNGVFSAYGATLTTTAHSYAPSAPRGQTTCTSVAARDKAGNVSAWSLDRCTAVPLDDRSLSATSGFRRLTTSAAYAGTYSSAARAGQYLRLSSVTGRRVVLVATTCRTCGSVRVAVGSTVKTVNLSSASTHWRVVFVLDLGAVRSGVLTVTTTSSRTVDIDGVGLSRT